MISPSELNRMTSIRLMIFSPTNSKEERESGRHETARWDRGAARFSVVQEKEKTKKWGIELPLHKIALALVLPQAGLTSEFGKGSGVTPPP